MIENFDDLFDKFFDGQSKKSTNKKFEDLLNDFTNNSKLDDFGKIKDLTNKLNSFDELDGLVNNPFEKELGEPDETTTYTEGGHTFEKKIWNLEHGQMVKVNIILTPLDSGILTKGGIKVSDMVLEEQIELAISEERYEDAAYFRDKIKQREAVKIKKEKKNTKTK